MRLTKLSLGAKKQYVWAEIDVDGTKANALIGRKIFRGTALDTPDGELKLMTPSLRVLTNMLKIY